MKLWFIFLFGFLIIQCTMAQPTKSIQTEGLVDGTVYIIDSINENIQDNSTKKEYCSAQKFKVLKGKRYKGQVPVLWFSTGSKGEFSISLKPGNYIIVEYERPEKFKIFKRPFEGLYKKKCLKKSWKKPLAKYTATTDHPIALSILVKKNLILKPACKK